MVPWHFVTLTIHLARNSNNLPKIEGMVFPNAHSRFGLMIAVGSQHARIS